MADNFTRNKFEWLEGVARAKGLPATAYRVSILIIENLNRKTGDAWPAVATLAQALSAKDDTVRQALKSLKVAGWLEYESTQGRGKSNRYSIKFPIQNDELNPPITGGLNHENPTKVGGFNNSENPPESGIKPPCLGNKIPPSQGDNTYDNPMIDSIEKDISIAPNVFDDVSEDANLEAQELSFDDVARVYPVGVVEDLKWAKRDFEKIIKNREATAEELRSKASRFASVCLKAQVPEEFIPQMQNWFKRGLWKNEEVWPKPKNTNQAKQKKKSAIELAHERSLVTEGGVS